LFIPNTKIDLAFLDEFKAALEDPNSVKIEPKIYKIYDILLTEFSKETKKYISSRTANKMLKIMKAKALLDGRTTVNFDDMQELRYAMCVSNNEKEENIFDACYSKHVSQADEIEKVSEELNQIKAKVSNIASMLPTLGDVEALNNLRELNAINQALSSRGYPSDEIRVRAQKIANEARTIFENSKELVFNNNEIGVKYESGPKQIEAESVDPFTKGTIVNLINNGGKIRGGADTECPF
jgi:hypothetical protein